MHISTVDRVVFEIVPVDAILNWAWHCFSVCVENMTNEPYDKMSEHSKRCVHKEIGQGRHFVTFQSNCLIFKNNIEAGPSPRS